MKLTPFALWGCTSWFLELSSGFSLVSTPRKRYVSSLYSLTELNVENGNNEISTKKFMEFDLEESGEKPNAALLVDGAADLTNEQMKLLTSDGVLRVDSALSSNVTQALSDHFLEQKILAWFATIQADVMEPIERYFYGGETSETRCALQLSLLRGGFAADNNRTCDSERHILADSLLELFGEDGTLRSLCDELITKEGPLLSLSALITEPGNDREDIPNDDNEGRYTISVALSDETYSTSPTNFLLGTHANGNSEPSKDDLRVSTIKTGDAIIYDNRIFRSQRANHAQKGSTSVKLNISFGTPKSKTDGFSSQSTFYLRPGYQDILNFGDLQAALSAYENGDGNVFNKYGDGLEKKFENTVKSSE